MTLLEASCFTYDLHRRVQAHPKVVRWYARLMGIRLSVPVEDDEQDMSDEESLFDQTHGDW